MKHRTYEYEVLDHFLVYFINGDKSALENEEDDLRDFEQTVDEMINSVYPQHTSYHWSYSNEDESGNYGRCEITNCFGNRVTLQLVVMNVYGKE